jgi:hypothetical protein
MFNISKSAVLKSWRSVNIALFWLSCFIIAAANIWFLVDYRSKTKELQELKNRTGVDKQLLDKKFNTIYETIEKSNIRQRITADNQIRNLHYTIPHTFFHRLCPECAELWGKKKEDIAWVPEKRLAELREIERIALNKPKPKPEPEEPEEPYNIGQELDSIIHLLKSQSSFNYTMLISESYLLHYAKKHDHPAPGGRYFGECPECIALRDKQTTVTHPISKKRYQELLEIESKQKQ